MIYILIILIVICTYFIIDLNEKCRSYSFEEKYATTLSHLLGFLLFFLICCIIATLNNSHKLNYANNASNIIEEKNNKINSEIKATLVDFKDTNKEYVNNLPISQITLKYPELNSNELFKQKIDIYVKNENELFDLFIKNFISSNE